MGRRSRACQICRARKSRCLPGSTGLSCKRCEDSGAQCMPYEVTKRTSRSRRTEGRSMITGHGTPNSSREGANRPVPASGRQWPPGTLSPTKQAQVAAATEHTAGVFGQSLLAKLAMGEADQWPTCKSLEDQQASAFLDQYHRMSQTVPFATQLLSQSSQAPPQAGTCAAGDGVEKLAGVDEEMRAASGMLNRLLRDSPILLLAAVLTGSSSQPEFEKQADDLFRHVLADRVVVKGQKSLEILQSLLTYLTWYHHRFDPETLQFYQFLQLANGMVFDLGLPKKFAKIGELTPPVDHDLNEVRTFLLCYYLNCGGAVLGYDRPENMGCIGSLRNAAKILAAFSPRQHDKEALSWVELLYSVACHHKVGQPLACDEPPATSRLILLGDWETAHLQAGKSPPLVSSFHFTRAYTLLKSSKAKVPSIQDSRICIHHFHELLLGILGRELDYLIRLGIVEWAHLITTLFLLARLGYLEAQGDNRSSSPRPSPVHDYVIRFRSLLEDLRSRSRSDMVFKAPHLLGWLDKILVAVAERAKTSEALGGPGTEIGHRDSAYELVNSFLEKNEPQFTHLQQGSNGMMISSENFWGEFMSDWLNW